MADLQLKLGQDLYSGWKGISVNRSLEQLAHSFDLTLTDNRVGGARDIILGAPCEVRLDGKTIVTGYVDRIRPGYDGRRRTLTVSGRSKTGDLVDCSIPPSQIKSEARGQTLLQLAQTWCQPFGIRASSTVNDLQTLKTSSLEAGQTGFEYLERYARVAGVMLTTGANGDLVICRASQQRLTTALVLGGNIRSAEGEFNSRDRFSVYSMLGQETLSGDGWDSEGAATKVAMDIEDPSFSRRYRPTTIVADDLTEAEMRRRGEWQRNVHYGRSQQATYTVSGWHHSDGLWSPNVQVRVQDPWMGFDDVWLMLSGVKLIQDERGRRSQLTVMPTEAYDLIPIPEREAEGGWGE